MILLVEILIIAVLVMTFMALLADERKKRTKNMHALLLKGYWDGGERRSVERLNITIEVRYALNGTSNPAKSADISTKGIRLLMDERLEKGTPLKLEMKLPTEKDIIKASGQVAWVSEAIENEKGSPKRLFNTGIKFFSFSGPGEKKLFDFIYNPQILAD